ncbi:MAG: hypothetical protein KAX24_14270, partial [Anaerolineae bacterium]|nr:hypothetical protein [Anaerolineae bacterium]
MIRRTTRETRFFPKNMVSILFLTLIALTACSHVVLTPARPTPTVYYAPPTPAVHKPITPLSKPRPEVG